MSSAKAKKRHAREQVVVMDMGRKATKALHLQRRADGLHLLSFTVEEAPIYDKNLSVELLAEHIKAVHGALGSKCKQVAFVVGVNDSLVRQVELPAMPVESMRTVVRLNSKNYLQQDLTDHTFDCQVIGASAAAAEGARAAQAKQRVLVAGAKTQLVNDLAEAAKASGLTAVFIAPGTVCPCNAFEFSNPQAFGSATVALVDIGFKTSALTVIHAGEMVLNRVVATGSDQFTTGIAQGLGVEPSAAESLKLAVADEIKPHLQMLVRPLARELRTSIDFFENQHDTPVSEVHLSGATAKNPFILELLQEELMLPCLPWNPLQSVISDLPPERLSLMEEIAPEFVGAAGAAAVALN